MVGDSGTVLVANWETIAKIFAIRHGMRIFLFFKVNFIHFDTNIKVNTLNAKIVLEGCLEIQGMFWGQHERQCGEISKGRPEAPWMLTFPIFLERNCLFFIENFPRSKLVEVSRTVLGSKGGRVSTLPLV